VGLGSLWFPELLGLEQLPPQLLRPTAGSSSCLGGSCEGCRQQAAPPPSYNKLFLEDSPPSYTEAVVTAEQQEEGTAAAADKGS
jgi:hypothetical protein